MDLLMHKCAVYKGNIAILAEPNRNMAKLNPAWITDEYLDVAIYIPPTGFKVRETGNEKGYV